MEVTTTYWLSEIEVIVNNRALIFDREARCVYYVYNGINKECWEFKNLNWSDVWYKAVRKYHKSLNLTKKEHKG